MGGSDGLLVTSVVKDADGLTQKLVYGDLARTETVFTYDQRRRGRTLQTYCGPPSCRKVGQLDDPPPACKGHAAGELYGSSELTTFPLLLEDTEFTYDHVDNPIDLRRAYFTAAKGEADYEATAETEAAYLVANGVRLARLHHEPTLPVVDGDGLHVLLELADHLGSGSIVLDKATSELAERMTYQGYGSVESDYRPGRWGRASASQHAEKRPQATSISVS